MSRLALTSELLEEIRKELLATSVESCAVLFGRAVMKNGRLARLVVREQRLATPQDYLTRSSISACLKPEFVAEVAQRARRNGESLVFVHSHPFSLNEFSATDDSGEQLLVDFLNQRTPGIIHAALLLTPEVSIARVLGCKTRLEVVGVGEQLIRGRALDGEIDQPTYDRQIRVFGASGQMQLKNIKVGIIGLGGTGSVVTEQLAHLGIESFLLIDPDVVESTNLNRLVGATASDVGKPKTEVAASLARRIHPKVQIETLQSSILLAEVAKSLVDTDFIFCCTDSQGSRAVINQFAYQYLVPVIDMGVAIGTDGQLVTHIAGRTQMLAPGLGCLVCADLLNPEAVRVDLLTEFERAEDPYIVGAHEPAPAVISINSTMASLAVTMFLSAVAHIPAKARLLNYNGITGSTRSAQASQHPTCIACSYRGALARADEWPLPARLS